ncbi:MAG TPA: choice-of-anchor B family protein [Gemmatimonadales bacterium]|nr:choice-of-anchor B family protein [Gemmatimonadales bacterium]
MTRFRLPAGGALALGLLWAAPLATPLAAQQGNFSRSVAAGPTEVFVGEPENTYAPGTVYVYAPAGAGKWRRAAELTASDAANYDRFGSAVALDGATLAVGAVAADSGRGAVYLFQRDAKGAWKQTAKLTVPGLAKDAGLGSALALQGHLLVAGSQGSDSAVGAVYVFRKSGAAWQPAGKALAGDAGAKDGFGDALALVGGRLFVGAARQDSMTGAVYVFRDSSGTWAQEAKLRARGLEKRGRFGTAIVASGAKEVLVGAPGLAGNAGAVIVLRPDSSGGNWMERGRLLPFDGGPALFGMALAVDGRTVWVGAPAAGRFEGRVYQITRDTAGVGVAATKLAPKADVNSRLGFGGSLALAGGRGVVGQIADAFGEGSAILLSKGKTGGWTMDQRVEGEDRGLAAVTGGKVDCTDGRAKIFECRDMDMLSFLPVKAIGGRRGIELNDMWGWTDPATGREYAIIGRVDGTSFVDISDPLHPRYLGDLPKTAKANPAIWRDIKVYKDHAFIVSDGAGEHGMQVIDLKKVAAAKGAPVTFTEDAHYDKIHSAHNIVIDTVTGFAFAVGSSSGGETCGGGLHMIDIRDPLHPKFAGCFADPATGRAGTGYIHDAQCVVYHGPDAKFQGREICFNAAETALSIADVTDKAKPVALSHVPYPNVGYAHQGWLTEDQHYFYMNDELDELEGKTDGTRTLIWDVSQLADPVLVGAYVSKDKSSDHNLYIVGNTMYESNYLGGLRVIDITDRKNPQEVGFFDTVPVGPNEPGFGGSWSNYPFFKSGTVVMTSGKEGIFMLKKRQQPMTP